MLKILWEQAFCNLTFTAAAKFHGLKNKGSIALGKDGDLVIWDDKKKVTFWIK